MAKTLVEPAVDISPGATPRATLALCDPDIVKISHGFIPVFIDTLQDDATTSRFHENPGSYPVLRVHDLDGHDIGGRLDGNLVAGHLTVDQLKDQLRQALRTFASP
ncbi:MAG TPA: hypothetical protein VGO93_28865 [Candidatus Xenobia bacterium]